MENPSTWTLLTSSLAVSRLQDASTTWAFLKLQGLLRDQPGDRERFEQIVGEVLDEGPITGPTEAARIAACMASDKLTTARAEHADPDGRIAHQRSAIVADWTG